MFHLDGRAVGASPSQTALWRVEAGVGRVDGDMEQLRERGDGKPFDLVEQEYGAPIDIEFLERAPRKFDRLLGDEMIGG